ncbi:hypothetical protein ACQZV8_08805 [Magnetococcales bacterium HHB-1]
MFSMHSLKTDISRYLIAIVLLLVYPKILWSLEQENDFPYGVYDGPMRLGSVYAQFAENDDQLLIRSDHYLFSVLSRALQPSTVKNIRNKIVSQRYLSLKQLHLAGLDLYFDESNDKLFLKADPATRKEREISLIEKTIPEKPTHFSYPTSAYLNIYSDIALYDSQGESPDPTWRFEGATHFKDFVLEWSANHTPRNDPKTQLDSIRWIYDDQKNLIRYTLGDLKPRLSTFQTLPPLAGLGVTKYRTMQPHDVTSVRRKQTFTIHKPSKITIQVNGIDRIKDLRLNPGNYRLTELELEQGINAAKIIVTDEKTGATRNIFIKDPFHSNQLLATGLNDFALYIGIPPSTDQSHLITSYNFADPVLSMFYKQGINPWLTATSSIQSNQKQRLLGMELLLTSPLGISTIEAAANQSDHSSDGMALTWQQQYRYAADKNWSQHDFMVNFSYWSPYFSTITDQLSFNNIAWQTTTNYRFLFTEGILKGTGINLGNTYTVKRDGNRDVYNITGQLSRQILPNLHLNAQISKEKTTIPEQEIRGTITLSWHPVNRQYSVRTRHNLFDDIHSIAASYTPEQQIGTVQSGLSLSEQGNAWQIDTYGTYTGYRGKARLTTRHTKSDEGKEQQNWQLGLQSAVVYAGGKFALANTVQDSFSIIQPGKSIQHKKINVDSQTLTLPSFTQSLFQIKSKENNTAKTDIYYHAMSDFWGPAVLSDLSSYQTRRIHIQAEDMPFDVESDQTVVILPKYKSGFIMAFNPPIMLKAKATLLDQQGSPITQYIDAFVIPYDKKDTIVSCVFSMDGIINDILIPRAGAYRIVFKTLPTYEVTLTIPKTQTIDSTPFDAGTLTIRPSKQAWSKKWTCPDES